MPDGFIKQDKVGSYEDFISQFQKHYPKMSLKCFAYIMKFCSKLMGRGSEASVYAIPKIDDYCIRINKTSKLGFFKEVMPLHKVPNNFYGLNFGQAVATNDEGISILMKCKGEEFGIKDWIKFYDKDKTPSPEEIDKCISDMARVSEFPQSAFDDLMKRVSLIKNVKRRHFDFFNPNNLLIDYKNQRINAVDVSHKTMFDFSILPLETALCDKEVLLLANPEQKANFEKYAKVITEKSRSARENYFDTFSKRNDF